MVDLFGGAVAGINPRSIPPPAPASGPFGFLHNLYSDVGQIVTGFVPGTIEIGKDIATGNIGALEQMGKGLVSNYASRYGSPSGFARGLYQHPGQFLLDLLGAGQLAGKAAEAASTSGALADALHAEQTQRVLNAATGGKLADLSTERTASGLGIPTFHVPQVPKLNPYEQVMKAILPPTLPRHLLGPTGNIEAMLPAYSPNPVARLLRGQTGPIHALLSEKVTSLEARAKQMASDAMAIEDPRALETARHLTEVARRARILGLDTVESQKIREARMKSLVLRNIFPIRAKNLKVRQDALQAFSNSLMNNLSPDQAKLSFAYMHGIGEQFVDPGTKQFDTMVRGPDGNAQVYYHGAGTGYGQIDLEHGHPGMLGGQMHYMTSSPQIGWEYALARYLDSLDRIPVDHKDLLGTEMMRELNRTAQQYDPAQFPALHAELNSQAETIDHWRDGRLPASALNTLGMKMFDGEPGPLPVSRIKQIADGLGIQSDWSPNIRASYIRSERQFVIDHHLPISEQEKASVIRSVSKTIGEINVEDPKMAGAGQIFVNDLRNAGTYDEVWKKLTDTFGKDEANRVVQDAGYDSFRYSGGQRWAVSGRGAGVGAAEQHDVIAVWNPENVISKYVHGPDFVQQLPKHATGFDELPTQVAAVRDRVAGAQRAEVANYDAPYRALLEARAEPGTPIEKVKYDPNEQRLSIQAPNIEAMKQVPLAILKAFGADGFYDVQNYVDRPGPMGFSGLGLDVQLQDGTLAHIEVHTPSSQLVRDHIGNASRLLEQSAADLRAATTPEAYGEAQVKMLKRQAYVESKWGAARRMIEHELGGRPLAGLDAAREEMRLHALQYIEAPLMAGMEPILTPEMHFNHTHMALQMMRGAKWSSATGDFVPTEDLIANFHGDAEAAALHIDPLTIFRDRAEQNLPMPVYVPHFDTVRDNLMNYGLVNAKTIGMQTANAFGMKESHGYLVRDWIDQLREAEKSGTSAEFRKAVEVQTPKRQWRSASGAGGLRAQTNIPEILTMRAARVQRFVEAEKLISHIANTFGREVGQLGKINMANIGSDERLFIPQGLLRFFRQKVGIDDIIARNHGDISGAVREVIQSMTGENADSVLKELQTIGVTKQGIKVYAIPRSVADAIEATLVPKMGKNVRLFWDTPMNVWRSFVLQGSPRWLVNNLLGNIAFLKMQGGRLSDVLRQLDGDYRRRLSNIMPEGVEGGLFGATTETYNARLGAARDTAVGQAFDAASQFTSTRAPFKQIRKWGAAMQNANAAIEDAFRRASFLKAAEKDLIRRNVLSNGHRFWTSQETLRQIARHGQDAETATKAVGEVNYFLNDYRSMAPFERQVVRRFIAPFWSFYRHVARLSVMYAVDYPLRAEVMSSLSQINKEMQDDQLGATVPSWMQGVVPFGSILASTRGMDPFQTITQSPVQVANPAIKMFLEMTTGRSMLSGKPFTTEGVQTPFGSSQAFTVRDGKVFTVGMVHPSFMEEMLSQFPLYTETKQVVSALHGSGATYDTASLFDLLRGHGVIRDNRGQIKYPVNAMSAYGLPQILGGFLGARYYPRSSLEQWQKYLLQDVKVAQQQANPQGGQVNLFG